MGTIVALIPPRPAWRANWVAGILARSSSPGWMSHTLPPATFWSSGQPPPHRRCALHKSYRGQKGAEDATKDWLTDAVTED